MNPNLPGKIESETPASVPGFSICSGTLSVPMNKIIPLLLIFACGWLIWSLTTSVESSAAGYHEKTDEISREMDPNFKESNRRTATDEAASKARSWQRSLTDAIPGTPATKKNILFGVGAVAAALLTWSVFRKK